MLYLVHEGDYIMIIEGIFVLIIALSYNGAAITAVEFDSKAQCVQAREALVDNRGILWAECVKK